MITTEQIKYAQGLNSLKNKYKETHNFEDILTEAHLFDEKTFEKTMTNANEGDEWKYFIEQCTKPFRYYDIVDIAKVYRKLLKETFGKDIKFNIKSERGYTDTLWITIKPQTEKYLTPLDEFMDEYKKEYKWAYGIEHPYTNDEVFMKYSKSDINRLSPTVREIIREITHIFEMDNSDIMIDYFDINYIVWYKLEVDGESHPGYTGI